MVALSSSAGLAVRWSEVSLAIWAGTFYSVIVSAFFGWLIWVWVNAVRGVARSAPLMYLMPPVAGLVAWGLTGRALFRRRQDRRRGDHRCGGVALAQFTSSPRDPVREHPRRPVD